MRFGSAQATSSREGYFHRLDRGWKASAAFFVIESQGFDADIRSSSLASQSLVDIPTFGEHRTSSMNQPDVDLPFAFFDVGRHDQ